MMRKLLLSLGVLLLAVYAIRLAIKHDANVIREVPVAYRGTWKQLTVQAGGDTRRVLEMLPDRFRWNDTEDGGMLPWVSVKDYDGGSSYVVLYTGPGLGVRLSFDDVTAALMITEFWEGGEGKSVALERIKR